MDQLLLPYLEANDESDRQRYLTELLTQYAVPEVRLTLRRRLSFFVDSHGKSSHNQDAEDLFQEIMTRIVQALHELREPSATTVIEDLKEYIARITTNCCNDVLRTKSPSRTRLMYKLRFVLSHHADFSIWKSDRRTMTGLTEWRHEEMSPAYVTVSADSEDRLARFRSDRFPGEYIKRVPLTRLVAEVFRWLSSPVELDELVTIVAAIQDVKDSPTEALHDSHLLDIESDLSDATLTSHARLEGREILRRLWQALRELSVEQRDVFCLGFEDDRGRDLFTVLLESEIVTFREITQELDRSTEKLVKLWSQMPMDNAAIAAELKTTRGQVYKWRFRALEKLRRGLLPFSGEK
jgi:RNA polymerase sigma factor (sigma-70 family)